MMMLGFVAALTDTAVQMNLCYELSLMNFLLKNITSEYNFLVVYYTCMISCITGFVNIYLKVVRKKSPSVTKHKGRLFIMLCF